MADEFESEAINWPGVMSPTPTPEVELSPAVQKFDSCRWRQIVEDGIPAHCTHRDVAPMAGTHGFDPEAWCTDCAFYKVRRQPRKRPFPSQQDRYGY